MIRAVVLAALATLATLATLGACGGSAPAPAPPPATPAEPTAAYVSAVACDASVPFACAFAIMADFKSRMCACTAKACAQALVKELNEYGKVPPPAGDHAATMGEPDSQRMYQLGVDTNECAKRALTAA